MPSTDITAVHVESLIKSYRSKKNYIESWFKRVRNELQVWMEHHPERRIHSIRGRLKDEEHFRDKVARKGSDWTPQNVFDKVEDFAGMRILTLYRNDLAILDYFIYRSSVWRVLKAEANYDKARHHDDVWFQDLGFKKCEDLDGKGAKCPCRSKLECTNNRKLIKNDRGYSSIHYILVPKDMSVEHWKQNRHMKCELQIRTIHEEAWGEFSHEFSYPHEATDPLAGKRLPPRKAVGPIICLDTVMLSHPLIFIPHRTRLRRCDVRAVFRRSVASGGVTVRRAYWG